MYDAVKKLSPTDHLPSESTLDEGSTTVSSRKYPELKDLSVGEPVSGSWEGQVASINGDAVTIKYSSIEFEVENAATKEFNKMTGKKSKPGPAEEDEEDEDY